MAKWRKPPAALVTLFEKATATLSNVEPRTMFGFPAAFCNGNMFAGLFQDRMILRLPDAHRAAFVKAYDARAFEPVPGRVMREYVEVPHEVQVTARLLRASLVKGRDYAASLPPKVKAPSARRSTRASVPSSPGGRKSSRR